MKVLVISDIHENFHNLLLALEKGKEYGVEQIICLGDLMNSGIAKVLSIQDVPSFMVWGNNDGEKVEITQTALRTKSNLSIAVNVYDFMTIGDRKLFLSHYDDLARPMALSGLYDAVFYGHNHKVAHSYVGDTLVVNPGELCAQKSGVATLAIYDTSDNSAEIITLEDSVTLKTDKVDNYFRDNAEKLGFRSEFVYKDVR